MPERCCALVTLVYAARTEVSYGIQYAQDLVSSRRPAASKLPKKFLGDVVDWLK